MHWDNAFDSSLVCRLVSIRRTSANTLLTAKNYPSMNLTRCFNSCFSRSTKVNHLPPPLDSPPFMPALCILFSAVILLASLWKGHLDNKNHASPIPKGSPLESFERPGLSRVIQKTGHFNRKQVLCIFVGQA